MKRLIIFLVRKKLGLKKYEGFRFPRQSSYCTWYYFDDTSVIKVKEWDGKVTRKPSNVSLNWLLDNDCKVVKINDICRKGECGS